MRILTYADKQAMIERTHTLGRPPAKPTKPQQHLADRVMRRQARLVRAQQAAAKTAADAAAADAAVAAAALARDKLRQQFVASSIMPPCPPSRQQLQHKRASLRREINLLTAALADVETTLAAHPDVTPAT